MKISSIYSLQKNMKKFLIFFYSSFTLRAEFLSCMDFRIFWCKQTNYVTDKWREQLRKC